MALKARQGAPSLHALDGLDLVAINPVILVRGPNIALVQVDLRARLLQRLGVVVADGHAVEDRARLVLVLPQQPRTPIAPDMVDVLHAAGARAIHLLECARVYEWEHHVDKADVSVGTLWLLGVDLASGVPGVTVLVLDLALSSSSSSVWFASFTVGAAMRDFVAKASSKSCVRFVCRRSTPSSRSQTHLYCFLLTTSGRNSWERISCGGNPDALFLLIFQFFKPEYWI
eukprot:UN3501